MPSRTLLQSQLAFVAQLEHTLSDWKAFGAVSTPKEVVDLMISLSGVRDWKNLDILEPACGFCNFLLRIFERYPHNRFYGVEVNPEVFRNIQNAYKELPFQLILEDYLLWEPHRSFDVVIGNPPYGIIGDTSHYPIEDKLSRKRAYKKVFHTWFGKYNIYGAFVEKSVSLLKEGGRLVFIIPATWMVLDEFHLLRQFLARNGSLKVFYLGGGIFRGVSVSVCVIVFEKRKKSGASLYLRKGKTNKFQHIASFPNWGGEVLRFETDETRRLESGVALLGSLFDIKISARSPEVKRLVSQLEGTHYQRGEQLPLMNGRNIKEGFVDRTNYVGLSLPKQFVPVLKHFYAITPRIVVGHTKGGRIVAALEDSPYPYVGDVYHLLPKTALSQRELSTIIQWLNSARLNNYIKTLYQDITPHTTATQLRLVPLPKGILKGKNLFD
ncbi:SAM-dependent methyltransferase [Candidatus Parcubacteria bacterium]|nr:MAG: SAM-dependent methyltransferase [Candidatus Parcubacteria bacterium]